ncbi:MAG: hypothetical protein ABWZ82_06755 [Candidatus Limnocylindrales bacterium]
MPAPFDYPRILSQADAAETSDPDARSAHARRAGGRRRRFRLPGWLTEVRHTSGEGSSMPTLRDYPWRSSDGA